MILLMFLNDVAVLSEVGNSARGYCELAGRVEPVLGDIMMALINMGMWIWILYLNKQYVVYIFIIFEISKMRIDPHWFVGSQIKWGTCFW